MAGEKRSQDYEDARDEKIIIVDIEGTTTSISFVKDTLFPYVRNNLKDYIEKNWENAEFKEDVKKLKEMATKDEADKIEGFVPITDSTTDEEKESLMKNILWQMDNDRKSGGLKQLQGHMWRDAYKSGAVKGHVYEDVPKSLEAWTKDNRKIYVYSSGSVEAQKLLFENTENGSLLKYFTDYYDTEIGEKQQTSSYKNILTKIDTEGKNVLFLTDVTKEAQAAIDAGMSSVIVIREGNAELTNEEKNKFTTIKSFDDLLFKTSAKRVKIDDTIEAEKNDTKVVTDEAKKTDKVETTTATTTDVEMKDVSTSNVEKKENKEDDKSKEEPMQVETKETKVDDVVVTKKEEEEKEVKKNDTSVVKNDTSVVKIDEQVEKKNDKIEEPVVRASTSEVKSNEKETTTTTTTTTTPTKKITTEETTKKDTVVDDKKIDENTQVQKKSETTSQKSTEENKSDKIEKTNEKIIVETEETKTKTEVEVKKIEVEKTNNDTTVKTVETTKTEETNDKKDKKDDDIVEKVKNTDEKISDKPIPEEVKQNGDSKKLTDKNETTTTTTATTPTPTPTVTETKVPETTKVTNGQKTELNGDSKKVETIEKKETEVKVASVNNETTTSSSTTTTTKTDDELAKSEPAKKEEDEKPKNDDEKQRVNGNTDDKNDKTHQNGVNEEKSKNGESSTDTESFKVKKVVEIIADGAGEAEVAPPVVVAATS